MVRYAPWGIVLMLMGVAAAGCAGGRVFSVDVVFTASAPPPAYPPDRTPPRVAVTLFEDARAIRDYVGVRTSSGGAQDRYQVRVSQPLEEVIAEAVRSHLDSAGVPATIVSGWDGREETIPSLWHEFVLGGRIRTFWVDALTELARTKVQVRVKLDVVLASTAERRIVWSSPVDSTLEVVEFGLVNEMVRQAVNDAFSSAINRIVRDVYFQNILWRAGTALREATPSPK